MINLYAKFLSSPVTATREAMPNVYKKLSYYRGTASHTLSVGIYIKISWDVGITKVSNNKWPSTSLIPGNILGAATLAMSRWGQ